MADPGFLRPNSLCLVERSLIVKRDLSFLCSVQVAGYRPQTKLREGNIFTPVGHSVHRGGSLSGVYLSRGVSVREIPRTVTSGRYASYWNAFLLFVHLDHCPSFTPFGKVTRIFSLFFFFNFDTEMFRVIQSKFDFFTFTLLRIANMGTSCLEYRKHISVEKS